MKQTATYLFVIILALLVFYGGAGVNLVSYCCNDCETEGVEVLLDDKCCEIHEHSHLANAPSIMESADQLSVLMHDNCCDIERVNFDWSRTPVQTLDLQPAVFDLFYNNLFNLSLIPLLALTEKSSVMANGPPVLCPHIYLSLLTTLLI